MNLVDVTIVVMPALFLGAKILLSSLFFKKFSLVHFLTTPIFKLASVGFQAAYMLGFCSGQAALIATAVNLAYMLLGEGDTSGFRR